MRLVTVVLTVLLLLIQYPLWLGHGGWLRVRALQAELVEQQQKNSVLKGHNERLAGEVSSLGEGMTAIEERARYDLGMIKADEAFVHFVSPTTPLPTPPAAQSLARKRGRISAQPASVVPDPPSRLTKPSKLVKRSNREPENKKK